MLQFCIWTLFQCCPPNSWSRQITSAAAATTTTAPSTSTTRHSSPVAFPPSTRLTRWPLTFICFCGVTWLKAIKQWLSTCQIPMDHTQRFTRRMWRLCANSTAARFTVTLRTTRTTTASLWRQKCSISPFSVSKYMFLTGFHQECAISFSCRIIVWHPAPTSS